MKDKSEGFETMTRDEKRWLFDSIGSWIRFSDAKAGAVVGIQGLVLGLLFRSLTDILSPLNAHDEWSSWLWTGATVLAAGSLGLLASIGTAAAAVLPRLKVGEPTSGIYFMHIAEHPSTKAYSEVISAESYRFEDDLLTQIHVNSFVAKKKYVLVVWAMRIALAADILVLLSVAILLANKA